MRIESNGALEGGVDFFGEDEGGEGIRTTSLGTVGSAKPNERSTGGSGGSGLTLSDGHIEEILSVEGAAEKEVICGGVGPGERRLEQRDGVTNATFEQGRFGGRW